MTFSKRGGRKLVVTPDGASWAPRPRVDNAMVEALARAFRWQQMLDEGVCGTIEELAKRERVNRGYMSRALRLTLLAPDIVEAILDGAAAGRDAAGSAGRVSGAVGAAAAGVGLIGAVVAARVFG